MIDCAANQINLITAIPRLHLHDKEPRSSQTAFGKLRRKGFTYTTRILGHRGQLLVDYAANLINALLKLHFHGDKDPRSPRTSLIDCAANQSTFYQCFPYTAKRILGHREQRLIDYAANLINSLLKLHFYGDKDPRSPRTALIDYAANLINALLKLHFHGNKDPRSPRTAFDRLRRKSINVLPMLPLHGEKGPQSLWTVIDRLHSKSIN